jgi:hypothetical protein
MTSLWQSGHVFNGLRECQTGSGFGNCVLAGIATFTFPLDRIAGGRLRVVALPSNVGTVRRNVGQRQAQQRMTHEKIDPCSPEHASLLRHSRPGESTSVE